jgi:hypothetical protein
LRPPANENTAPEHPESIPTSRGLTKAHGRPQPSRRRETADLEMVIFKNIDLNSLTVHGSLFRLDSEEYAP